MKLSITSIAAIAAVATAVTQLLLGLALGSFSAGTQLEQVQTELKLIRKDLQSQYELIESKDKLYDYRLQILERQQAKIIK